MNVDKSTESGKLKHEGFRKQASNYTETQSNRALRSLEKQIAKHQDKINNPEKHFDDWNTFSNEQKEGRKIIGKKN